MLDPNYLLSVLLVFVRISGLLLAAPFFNQQSFSVRIRVLFAFVLAYSMAGLVAEPLPDYAFHAFGFMAAIGVEAMTGLVIGFTAQFLFLAVQFAGEIIGFQMALGIAQVFDPVNGQSANPVGRLLSLIFLLVFVLTDGHHLVLRALEQSFVVVPLGGATLQASGPLLLDWTADFFTLALRLAAPYPNPLSVHRTPPAHEQGHGEGPPHPGAREVPRDARRGTPHAVPRQHQRLYRTVAHANDRRVRPRRATRLWS